MGIQPGFKETPFGDDEIALVSGDGSGNVVNVNSNKELTTSDTAVHTDLLSINSKLDPLVLVNNLKQQILSAIDRVQNLSYADFGTKNQRVIQIDYSANSIGTGPGFTARKTLIYTLVGNSYRRDNIVWSII